MKLYFMAALLFLTASIDGCWSEEVDFKGFNGTWEGKVVTRRLDLNAVGVIREFPESRYRLVVSGDKVHVFRMTKDDNGWVEEKANKYRIVTLKTNAVIYVIDSAPGAAWVETIVYSLMHKDKDHLYLYRTRAIDNYLEAADKEGSRGFQLGGGEVARVR